MEYTILTSCLDNLKKVQENTSTIIIRVRSNFLPHFDTYSGYHAGGGSVGRLMVYFDWNSVLLYSVLIYLIFTFFSFLLFNLLIMYRDD